MRPWSSATEICQETFSCSEIPSSGPIQGHHCFSVSATGAVTKQARYATQRPESHTHAPEQCLDMIVSTVFIFMKQYTSVVDVKVRHNEKLNNVLWEKFVLI